MTKILARNYSGADTAFVKGAEGGGVTAQLHAAKGSASAHSTDQSAGQNFIFIRMGSRGTFVVVTARSRLM